MLKSFRVASLKSRVFRFNQSIKFFAEKKKVCVVDNPYTLEVTNYIYNINCLEICRSTLR